MLTVPHGQLRGRQGPQKLVPVPVLCRAVEGCYITCLAGQKRGRAGTPGSIQPVLLPNSKCPHPQVSPSPGVHTRVRGGTMGPSWLLALQTW